MSYDLCCWGGNLPRCTPCGFRLLPLARSPKTFDVGAVNITVSFQYQICGMMCGNMFWHIKTYLIFWNFHCPLVFNLPKLRSYNATYLPFGHSIRANMSPRRRLACWVQTTCSMINIFSVHLYGSTSVMSKNLGHSVLWNCRTSSQQFRETSYIRHAIVSIS